MRFQEIAGHKSLQLQLVSAVDEGRLAHALLFLGKTGSGLLPFGLALAQYILCENKNGEDACGTCKGCSKAAKLIHPDLHFTFPVVKKDKQKDPPISGDRMTEWREAVAENPYQGYNDWLMRMDAENKQGNITARECQDIVRRLGMKTFESPYKVLLIWKAELLRKEGNRLLKIIEEPPANTVIILMAEDENQILNTILSRTQIYRMKPLEDEEIMNWLVEKEGLTPEQAKEKAYLGDGDLNRAMQLASSSEESNAEEFRKWMLMIIKDEWSDLMDWINQTASLGRERQKHFVEYGLHFLSEALKVSVNPDYEPRIAAGYRKMIDFLTREMDSQSMDAVTRLLEELHYFIERNAYIKVHLLNVSLKMKQVILEKKELKTATLIR